MDDLISRQAAIEIFDCSIGGVPVESVKYVSEYADKMISRINALPSAQSERKTGKWIQNDNGTYSCSLCQSWIPEEQSYYARFCLYCGADMIGRIK